MSDLVCHGLGKFADVGQVPFLTQHSCIHAKDSDGELSLVQDFAVVYADGSIGVEKWLRRA